MLCKYFGYYIYTCIMPIGSNKGWRRPIIRMVFSKLITFSIITYSVASCKTNYTRRSIIYNINRCVRLHWSYYSLDSWAKNQTGNALVRLYSLSCCSPLFFFHPTFSRLLWFLFSKPVFCCNNIWWWFFPFFLWRQLAIIYAYPAVYKVLSWSVTSSWKCQAHAIVKHWSAWSFFFFSFCTVGPHIRNRMTG